MDRSGLRDGRLVHDSTSSKSFCALAPSIATSMPFHAQYISATTFLPQAYKTLGGPLLKSTHLAASPSSLHLCKIKRQHHRRHADLRQNPHG